MQRVIFYTGFEVDCREFDPLRLQRWMGHHAPAFTLETHGHLIDDLGPALDLRRVAP